jgi:glucose/arabinose dehydrogenase
MKSKQSYRVHSLRGAESARRPACRLIRPLVALAAALLASQGAVPARAVEVLHLLEVASGLTAPAGAAHAGDGSGRMFIVDQSGQIRVLHPSSGLLPAPYLDVSSELVSLGVGGPGSFDERGLLSVAFHPDFENNGRFYTYSSQPVDGDADFTVPLPAGASFNHQAVITEYTATDPSSNVFSGASREILRIDEPQFNHNGGQTAFGPDGKLYISLGDGGGGNDVGNGHTAGIGNGQDRTNVLGSLLRIDVDGNNSANGQYGIPNDNPFLGEAGAVGELYAHGLRNPWRFSFDDGPGGTQRLFLGDVGQNLFEEVNIVSAGDDFGWNVKEGNHLFDPNNPATVTPDPGGTTGPGGETLVDPILEYFNGNNPNIQAGDSFGRAVVNGFVYRGSNPDLDELLGKLVFGDWSRNFGAGDGSLFVAEETSPGEFAMQEVLADFGSGPQRLGFFLLGFGENEAGELYLLVNETGTPFELTGRIFKVVPEPSSVLLVLIASLSCAILARRKRTAD